MSISHKRETQISPRTAHQTHRDSATETQEPHTLVHCEGHEGHGSLVEQEPRENHLKQRWLSVQWAYLTLRTRVCAYIGA